MKIDIRECDDWIAVYKDGKKVWENHSCPLVDGLAALGIPFKREYDDRDPFTVDIDFPDTLP